MRNDSHRAVSNRRRCPAFVQSVEKQGENLAVDSTKSACNREKLFVILQLTSKQYPFEMDCYRFGGQNQISRRSCHQRASCICAEVWFFFIFCMFSDKIGIPKATPHNLRANHSCSIMRYCLIKKVVSKMFGKLKNLFGGDTGITIAAPTAGTVVALERCTRPDVRAGHPRARHRHRAERRPHHGSGGRLDRCDVRDRSRRFHDDGGRRGAAHPCRHRHRTA